jgi:membrane associated rhomboid family serine protease
MLLHGSWSHILGNMVCLGAFRPGIKDAMISRRYAVFYGAGGLVVMRAQAVADRAFTIPNLGASGGIVAAMGALLITCPRDQTRTFCLSAGSSASRSFLPHF